MKTDGPKTEPNEGKTNVELVSVANGVEVKIYRRERTIRGATYSVFEVVDRSTGRRRLRSFSDHAKAVKEAKRISRALTNGHALVAQMGPSDVASWGRTLENLRPTDHAPELAAARYAAIIKEAGSWERVEQAVKFLKERDPAKLEQRTVADVVTELLAAKKARGKSDRYLGDLHSRLTRFAEAFKVDIHTITTGEVQRWLDKLKVAPQTAKNSRTVVGTLFSFAEARGYIFRGSNPVEATEKIEAPGGAVEIYRPAEMARLMAAASKEFRPCLALAAFAGLRTAEILRLEWSDIDLASGHIIVGADKAKTASRRVVPIADNLKAWLTLCPEKKGRLWKGDHDTFYDAQQETAADTTKDGQPALTWRQNACRHSYASYRLAQIQNAAQVAMECGNSQAVVFKHYRELVKPADAAKWFAIAPTKPAENVVQLPTAAVA